VTCKTFFDKKYSKEGWTKAVQATVITGVCPEPSALVLVGISAIGMLAREWRRRKARA
jgi:hypothetical protein